MEAVKELEKFREKVNKKLNFFFNKKIKKAAKVDPFAEKVAKKLREFTLRAGKRIRPTMMRYGYIASGGKKLKDIEETCIALEIIHTWLLIHDDIIDDDDMRHGGMAFHKMFSEVKNRHRTKTAKHGDFGISVTIATGDMAAALGYEILAKSDFPSDRKVEAIKGLSDVLIKVGQGEFLDVLLERKENVKDEDIFKVYFLKTGCYTMSGPLRLGAMLAGASDKILKGFEHYGYNLGVGFQIQDDILGMFGDEKKLGKPSDSDIKEGKRTLLVTHALKDGTKAQQRKIRSVLGNAKATKKDIDEVRKIFIETGSLEYSKNLAKEFAKKSRSIAGGMEIKKEGKDFLEGIADYIVEREY
ncbi:MAG: hypothetical protein ACD_63C00180G0002 [uncultured bacterium]|nr:MAG: hypothetical protein ACD_63C00180G0002 [uncultured bacterium]